MQLDPTHGPSLTGVSSTATGSIHTSHVDDPGLKHAEWCTMSDGTVMCRASGYTVDRHDFLPDISQMTPCPACNTVSWLANAKNQACLPNNTLGSAVQTEHVWLDALRVAYRENPEGAHAALEAVGAVEVHAAVPSGALSVVRHYNAPSGAMETLRDDAAIDAFALDLKVKMARNRAKGRGGWHDNAECSADALSQMLREHIDKGDPLDVAIISMMLHHRREQISQIGKNSAPVLNPI